MLEIVDYLVICGFLAVVMSFITVIIYALSNKSTFMLKDGLIEFKNQMNKELSEFKLSMSQEVNTYTNFAQTMEGRVSKLIKKVEDSINKAVNDVDEIVGDIGGGSGDLMILKEVLPLVKEFILKNKNALPAPATALSPYKQQIINTVQQRFESMTDEQVKKEVEGK